LTDVERREAAPPDRPGWDYAPAPEARDIVSLRERYGLFVGGTWLEPHETYTTISPATEEPLAEVAQATREEVTAAVDAARERSVRSTCFASRGSSKSARASSRCSSR